MKRKLLLVKLLSLMCLGLWGQNVPNRGFENWEETTLPHQFQNWRSSNEMFLLQGVDTFNVVRDPDAYAGAFSVRLETMEYGSDTLPAYVMSNGQIQGDSMGNLIGTGGVPFTAQPDSIVFWSKYQFAIADTGFGLVLFKTAGSTSKQVMVPLFGAQSTWTRQAFPLGAYTLTPDTVLIAFVSTNPDHPKVGSWLKVDGISFSGTTQNVFNPGFELEDTLPYSNPEAWTSTNKFSAFLQDDQALQMTNDAHSGQHAMRIEPVYFDAYNAKWGYATTGNLPNESGFTGGFPYHHAPSKFSGWYKYTPTSTDTAMVFVVVSAWDSIGDTSITLGFNGTTLTAANTYTYFEFPINYNTNYTVDIANIIVTPSKAMFGGAQDSVKLGSVLYLDDLWLHGDCDWTDTTALFSADTVAECAPVLLNAGSGYNSYLWSNGATNPTVSVGGTGPYSVAVSDSAQCSLSDTVYVIAIICPGFEEGIAPDMLEVYPNPSQGMLSIKYADAGPIRLELRGLDGKLLHQSQHPDGRQTSMDVSTLPAGSYILTVSSGKGTARRVVVKE